MTTISEFFEMGGYAGFVWPSYAVTAVLLIALLVLSIRFFKSQQAALEDLQGEGGKKDNEA